MDSELPLWLEHRLTSALFSCLPSTAVPRVEPLPSLGEKNWMEPLKVNHIDRNHLPPHRRSCPRPPALSIHLLCQSSARLLLRDAVRCGPSWLALSGSRWQQGWPWPCARSGRLCLSPGAASGARGKPVLQAKQRKVRVSSRELCPRLRKHILAEERNTIQAGRETQLPSNPLQEAFGFPTAAGVFTISSWAFYCYRLSCVCFLSFTPACCKRERTEQYRSNTGVA